MPIQVRDLRLLYVFIVDRYCYLGCMLSSEGTYNLEASSRINSSRAALSAAGKTLKSTFVTERARLLLLRSASQSRLLHHVASFPRVPAAATNRIHMQYVYSYRYARLSHPSLCRPHRGGMSRRGFIGAPKGGLWPGISSRCQATGDLSGPL